MLTPLSPNGYALGGDFRFLVLFMFLLGETRRLFVKHKKISKRIICMCFRHIRIPKILTPLSPKGCALGRDFRFLILVAFFIGRDAQIAHKTLKNVKTHNIHVF